MRETIHKVRDMLPAPQRRQAVRLFAMMTGMALLETAGVVSIVPFVIVVSNPETLSGDGWLAGVYAASGLDSERSFLFLLGVGVLVMLVAGNAFKALTVWRINRFTHLAGHAVGMRLMRSYLAQGYDYFLTRHTSELGKNVLAEVRQVITGLVQPGMMALSRLLVAIFLAGMLVVADPLLAVLVVTVLGGMYALLYAGTQAYLSRIGRERFRANRERFHLASEVFSGIKDVKLRGLENAYSDRFAAPSLRFARLQAVNQTLAQLPRYGLEVIAFGGVLLIVLYFLAVRNELGDALPFIALYVFAGYRMLPTFQQIFAAMAKVRFAQPALELLHADMNEKSAAAAATTAPSAKPLPFRREIRLEDVGYRYPSGDRPVLTSVSLEIPRGARVGFVGPTGSGKSTVVDLILGLLCPSEGTVFIDDEPLETEEAIRRWQRNIGYVPQHIFLADDTIAANIAFGEAAGEADRAAVEQAARMAQLHDFIVDELSDGYDTQVGERGIRLSGGQRQRLGLARALYREPAVLVLDEATSALDTETEEAVMKALEGLGRECTVIMIAHRLSTVRGCDSLFRLKEGRLIVKGSYRQVVGEKAMADG